VHGPARTNESPSAASVVLDIAILVPTIINERVTHLEHGSANLRAVRNVDLA